MGQLEDLQVFIRVADTGGIGKAAEQLGIAKSAVSRRLAELEKRLDTTLFSRTTRKIHLTEAGQRCYAYAIRAVDSMNELQAAVAEDVSNIKGLIRLSVPMSFALSHLTPVLDEFMQTYPGIHFDIDVTDRFVDLIEAGLDLAIRIGELKDSTLKAKMIAPVKMFLAASPEYLRIHGTPKTVADLEHHPFLVFRNTTAYPKYKDENGAEHTLNIKSVITINSGDLLSQFAIKNYGIVFTPTFISWKEFQSGALVKILPEQYSFKSQINAVYPNSRFLPKRIRLFIDFLAKKLGENPYWEFEKDST